MAVPGRLPRVVPDGDPFVVKGKIIPPGVGSILLEAFSPIYIWDANGVPVGSSDNRGHVGLHHA